MLKKSAINQLLRAHDPSSIERHVIYAFLQNQRLSYEENSILAPYLAGFDPDSNIFKEVSTWELAQVEALESCLELLIPPDDRKLNGAFFTPPYVVDFIIEQISPQYNHANLDPSCGCGAFLIGIARYYKRVFGKSVRETVRDNIFGVDILDYNIHRAKLILAVYALEQGEHLNPEDFNLFVQDSLRIEWNRSFDNVVGNPPYVKFQDLADENRDFLASRWSTIKGGTFNLYFAFFELGYQLLRAGGKLGYITPNNFFTSLSGEALRLYFHKHKCVYRIVDFNHKKVFDAQTYTSITFLSKQLSDAIMYDRIGEEQSPQDFLSRVNGSITPLQDLRPKKWRLLKTDEQFNIQRIETAGVPIGKLFDIHVGIATLKDEVFFVDGNKACKGNFLKTTPNGKFEIERDAVRPVFKISDIKSQEEVRHNNRKIIFPYRIYNGQAIVIPETEFSKLFPNCYAYLLSERDSLSSRDKGKVQYDPFYAWGRTQGLAKTGKKILTPTFSKKPRFIVVEQADAFFTNGYGLYCRSRTNDILFPGNESLMAEERNIDVVQKILNSCVMHYYVSKTSVSIEGGYPCYQKNFIEKFSIPSLDPDEIHWIRQMNAQPEIDAFLIGKYQLNFPVPNLLS